MKRRRIARRAWFVELKAKLACEHCAEQHPATLEFHHVNPEEKDDVVSYMVTHGWSEKRILAEIAKCITLCSNCHAKEHHRQRQEAKKDSRLQ